MHRTPVASALLGLVAALAGCQGDGNPDSGEVTTPDDDTADDDTADDDTADDDTADDDDSAAGDDDSAPAELPEVVINEFMASNGSTLQDETGAWPDWIELHNAGDVDADLTGCYLSDDLAEPTKWHFPDGTTISAGGHLVVFADGDTADGPLHAGFSLAAEGEAIAVYGPDGDGNPRLDALEYAAQVQDVSMARMPDGSTSWEPDSSPTPGEPNG